MDGLISIEEGFIIDGDKVTAAQKPLKETSQKLLDAAKDSKELAASMEQFEIG